jgi:hypothetical protein
MESYRSAELQRTVNVLVSSDTTYRWPHCYGVNGQHNVPLPEEFARYKGGFGYIRRDMCYDSDVNLFRHTPVEFCALPKKKKWEPEERVTITTKMVEGLKTTNKHSGHLGWDGNIINLVKDLYTAYKVPHKKPLVRGLVGWEVKNWQWEILIEYAFRVKRGSNPKHVLHELKRRVWLYLYKPDITSAPVNFYSTAEWRELRVEVLECYKCSCMMCNRNPREHNVTLHVDHIKPVSHHPQLALSFSNLQILCEDCNLGKRNIYSTDWRPQNAL